MKKFIPTFLFFIVLLLFLGCSSPEEPVFETESTSSGTSTPVVLGDNLTKGFMLDAENAFGTTVLCNGKSAKEFIPRVGETVNCLFKDLTLATFTGVEKKDPDQGLQMDEADQFLNQATKGANAVSISSRTILGSVLMNSPSFWIRPMQIKKPTQLHRPIPPKLMKRLLKGPPPVSNRILFR